MRIVYENLQGVTFSEENAREYYGDRFDSMVSNNLLIKVQVASEGNTIRKIRSSEPFNPIAIDPEKQEIADAIQMRREKEIGTRPNHASESVKYTNVAEIPNYAFTGTHYPLTKERVYKDLAKGIIEKMPYEMLQKLFALSEVAIPNTALATKFEAKLIITVTSK